MKHNQGRLFRSTTSYFEHTRCISASKPWHSKRTKATQAKIIIEQYFSHNLQYLTVEDVNSYIVSEVIPRMHALWAMESQLNGEVGPCNLSVEVFKKSLPLTKVLLGGCRSLLTTGGTQMKRKTKSELLHDLEQEGIAMTRGLGHSRKELQEFANQKGIATMKSVNKTTAGFL